jgi:hypothetical protein
MHLNPPSFSTINVTSWPDYLSQTLKSIFLVLLKTVRLVFKILSLSSFFSQFCLHKMFTISSTYIVWKCAKICMLKNVFSTSVQKNVEPETNVIMAGLGNTLYSNKYIRGWSRNGWSLTHGTLSGTTIIGYE